MVSTFATGQHLVLGQVKVAKKSNEIIAIPKLLNMFAIKGAIVTIDAIGCQRDIAQKILDNKANYVLALKGQPGIVARGRRAVRRGAEGQRLRGHRNQLGHDDRCRSRPHRNPNHHRIHDVEWLQKRHDWPGLKAVIMVESSREISGKIEHNTVLHHLTGHARGSSWASRT
jgi:predicted transposase YbfD/YdcC